MKKLLLIVFAVGSCLALLLAVIKAPDYVDAASYSPAKLKVNTSAIHAKKDCGYSTNHGWFCNVTVKNTSTNKNLKWTASSQPRSATSLSPSNGTLSPGQQSILTFFVGNLSCPSSFTLKFVGPINTVYIPWSCAATHLNSNTTDLNQFISAGNCTQIDLNQSGYYANWKCDVDLTEGNNDQGGLNWSSSIKGKSCYSTCTTGNEGSSINPSKGSIVSPSSLSIVTIVVPQDLSCGKSYVTLNFTFTGPANKVVLNYACTENPS